MLHSDLARLATNNLLSEPADTGFLMAPILAHLEFHNSKRDVVGCVGKLVQYSNIW